MTRLLTHPIGDFVEESTERVGRRPVTVYSVTNENGFVPSLELFDKQVFSADTYNYKRVLCNDLAYNPSRINVGSVALLRDPAGGAVSPMYVIVRCKPGLLPRYLLYFLKSDMGLSEIGHRCHGAVRDQLRFRDLCTIPLLIPALKEQERLVRLMDEVDHLQTLRRRADGRSADLGPALFFEMFGDPARPNGRWPAVPLKALGKIITGNTPSRAVPSYFGNAIEWVKTDNIDAAHGIVAKASEALSPQGIAVGRVVPQGSVLVTCIAGSRNRIGDAAVTDRAVAINQQINAIVPADQNHPIFICEMVRALKGVIQHRATGVMTGIISKSGLEGIPSIRAPLTLQRRFAETMSEVRDVEKEQSATSRRTGRLFRSLLYRAYSGEL